MSVKLSKMLYDLRAGRTQSVFATQLGVGEKTYAHWENGTRHPSFAQAQALAAALCVTMDGLVELIDMQKDEGPDSWYPRRWNDQVARWKDKPRKGIER